MAEHKQLIVFLPDWRGANPYQACLAAAIAARGWQVEFADIPRVRLPLLHLVRERRHAHALHLHWVQPLLAPQFWSDGWLRRRTRLALLALDLFLCRAHGVAVFWTIHNLVAHDSPDPDWELRVRRHLARHVTGCFVHSASARDLVERSYGTRLASPVLVPHASYVNVYPAAECDRVAALRAALGLADGDFVYLFIGAIRRYKGVEQLIDAFAALPDVDARLVIAGQPDTAETAAAVRARAARDTRVLLHAAFVADDDLTAFLAVADVVVLPFSQTLTSGSALLAMSAGKALLLPDAARVFDAPGDEGALYYAAGSLATALRTMRERDLIAMGKHNQDLAASRTWERMAELTTAAYAGTREE